MFSSRISIGFDVVFFLVANHFFSQHRPTVNLLNGYVFKIDTGMINIKIVTGNEEGIVVESWRGRGHCPARDTSLPKADDKINKLWAIIGVPGCCDCGCLDTEGQGRSGGAGRRGDGRGQARNRVGNMVCQHTPTLRGGVSRKHSGAHISLSGVF